MSAVENGDRGQAAMATYWVTTTIASFVVAARLYIRIVRKTIGVDDWLMLVTLFVSIISFATAKASVGCLILRLLGPDNVWRRRVVWFVIIFTPLINAINIALTFAQCDPPKALWDRKVKARCWNPNVQLYFAYFMVGKLQICPPIVDHAD
ncbi:MAG: hypothetical protein Q9214_001211 [Letrouitia sp. 1 TL-2023]